MERRAFHQAVTALAVTCLGGGTARANETIAGDKQVRKQYATVAALLANTVSYASTSVIAEVTSIGFYSWQASAGGGAIGPDAGGNYWSESGGSRPPSVTPPLSMPPLFSFSKLKESFSVLEAFDSDDQRQQIQERVATFDATGYINEAFAYAAARGYLTAHIPSGQYLINSGETRQGTIHALILLQPNLHVRGDGYGSRLVVGAGMIAKDYKVLAPYDDTINLGTATYSDFTIDGNGANNLVRSGVTRRAIPLCIPKADRITISRVSIENNPGRNGFALGNDGATVAGVAHGEISFCTLANQGSGIPGNSGQGDHSAIYTMFSESGLVAFNRVWNDTPIVGGKHCTAIETHGSYTLVTGNHFDKMGPAMNLAATAVNSVGNRVIGNRWTGLTDNGILLWTMGYTQTDTEISDNYIEIDNENYGGGSGIYQFPTSAASLPIFGLKVSGNTITFVKAPAKDINYGIHLTAVTNGEVKQNRLKNVTSSGIALLNGTALQDVKNIDITCNAFVDCGNSATNPFAIHINNTSLIPHFSVAIGGNTIKRTLQAAGVTPLAVRGVHVIGPGLMEVNDLGTNSYHNIQSGQKWVVDASVAPPSYYQRAARVVGSIPKAAVDPIYGDFEIGDRLDHSDVSTAGDYIGRVCTKAGFGGSTISYWLASTAYVVGQTVRFGSPGATKGVKILECVVGGTTGTTEPRVPAQLYTVIADGTAQWVYRANAYSTFHKYGALI